MACFAHNQKQAGGQGMGSVFFERPILNSPYAHPGRRWELIGSIPKTRTRRIAGQVGPELDRGAEHADGQEFNLTPLGDRPVNRILDGANPKGSTAFVIFTMSKTSCWQTNQQKCHVDWVVCGCDGEMEGGRAAEDHPGDFTNVKIHAPGFDRPDLRSAASRHSLPDRIVRVDDGRGAEESLNLVVEFKVDRGDDAKEEAETMSACSGTGVNQPAPFDRGAFAGFSAVHVVALPVAVLVKSYTTSQAA